MEKVSLKLQTLKNILSSKGVVSGGAAAAAGVGGYYQGKFVGTKRGYKSGAEKATNEMAIAFHDANQRENQKIVDSFKAFNRMENRGLAQNYYKRGLAAGAGLKEANMTKAASDAYEKAFEEELGKHAGMSSAIMGAAKTLGKSYKNLGSGIKEIGREAKVMAKHPKSMRKFHTGRIKNTAERTLKHSKAALGTTAGVGAAVAYAES